MVEQTIKAKKKPWLGTLIKAVLRARQGQRDALAEMMDMVSAKCLDRRGQLRVHDVHGEGILYGERQNVVAAQQDRPMQLSCSRIKFDDNKEEAFSRGLFNAKQLLLKGRQAFLISYEAPLLRRPSGYGGGICKLDLVAMDETAIWAIEYKQTYGQATSVRYGIVEALAYGFLLASHIRDHKAEMKQQVAKCFDRRGPFSKPSIPLPERVKFAVAGPFAFYRDDTRTARRRKLTDEICRIASDYASDVSERLNLQLSFGGFLVVGGENTSLDCKPAPDRNPGAVVPCFTPPISEVPVFDDIEQVRAYVEKRD